MKKIATLLEKDEYRSDLYQIDFKEGEFPWPMNCKEIDGDYGQARMEKCLKLRRERLANKKLGEAGVFLWWHSSHDCTGRRFTAGVEVIYTTNEYALVRIDSAIDC